MSLIQSRCRGSHMNMKMLIYCLLLALTGTLSLSAREAEPGSYKLPEKNTVISEKTDLSVSKLYRLTHPDYEIAHAFIINHDPWNRDRKRIVFCEDRRGPVWGYVEDLKKWKTKEEYLAASKGVIDNYVYRTYPAESMFWSPFEGEESILYGISTTTEKVIRIDVDKPADQRMEDVVSYAGDQTGNSGNDSLDKIADSYARGWTKDAKFTVVYRDKKGKEYGGIFVDVRKGAISNFDSIPVYVKAPKQPGDNAVWRNFPYRSSNHSAISQSGKYYAIYNGAQSDGVWNTFDGSFIKDAEINTGNPASAIYPNNTQYVSWRADDQWYISTTLGDSECRLVDGKKSWLSLEKGEKPALWPNRILQVYADTASGSCQYRELLTYYTTGHWINKYKDGPNAGTPFKVDNYHAHGISALRNDGRQLVYCANENNYSFNDLRFAKSAGLDTGYMDGKVSGIGLFLVEFK